MIKLKKLLKEATTKAFLQDKVSIRFPSVIAKDIKNAFSGIDFYIFKFNSEYFPPKETQKRYDRSGFISVHILLSKSDYNKALERVSPKYAKDLNNKLNLKTTPNLENFTNFLYQNINVKDFKFNSDLYFENIKSVEEKVHKKIEDIWNKVKSNSLDVFRVKDAYYHVAINDNLNPGDKIKPYFDAGLYAKQFTQRVGGDNSAQSFSITEDFLEENRPSGLPSRDKSAYIFKTVDDAIEYLHGGNRAIYAVKPIGSVVWVDMKWVDEIQSEILYFYNDCSNDYCEDSEDEKLLHKNLHDMAKKYWNGTATSSPVWEGITKGELEIIKKVKN
jgi:hypothetical protein